MDELEKILLQLLVVYTLANKKKVKTSTVVLIAAIVSNIAYTVAAFILQFKTSVEISSTLTTCWFSFWAVEVAALAGIKITKTKNMTEDY